MNFIMNAQMLETGLVCKEIFKLKKDMQFIIVIDFLHST